MFPNMTTPDLTEKWVLGEKLERVPGCFVIGTAERDPKGHFRGLGPLVAEFFGHAEDLQKVLLEAVQRYEGQGKRYTAHPSPEGETPYATACRVYHSAKGTADPEKHPVPVAIESCHDPKCAYYVASHWD